MDKYSSILMFLQRPFGLLKKQMAELFGAESHTSTYHLKSIFNSAKLDKNSTTRKIRAVQIEGNREILRDKKHYNLDVIISPGYRVITFPIFKYIINTSKI